MGYTWPVRFRDDDADEWVGENRTELADLTELFAGLTKIAEDDPPLAQNWRDVMPEGATFIRMLGDRTAHVRLRGQEINDIAVRIDLPKPGPLWRFTEQVVNSPSHRRYSWSHRLRAVGIDTPRPVGFLEHGEHPLLHKSFFVSEYILADNLIEFRDKTFAKLPVSRDTVLQKRALIADAAAVLRELHSRGYFVRQLRGHHLLAVGERVVLSGVELTERRIGRLRAAVENLVSLHRDFVETPGITRTDRLRFLDVYLRHRSERVARRRALYSQIGEHASA